MAHTWRHMCPVNGCKNFGGRGYARSTFIDHLNTHCQTFLTSEIERTRALQATSTFGDLRCCNLCGKLNREANGRQLCKKCSKETREFTLVKKNLSHADRTRLTAKIRMANRTTLKIMSDIPPLLRRHWSKCVSSTLGLFLTAHSETESFKALEAWTKLKSVLVLPLKGGAKRKRSTYKFYEKRMLQWIAGLHDICWEDAIEIEKGRTKQRNAAHKRKSQNPAPSEPQNLTGIEKALQRKYDRAKRLVNVGEYSQAMSSLLSNGTAPITDAVLEQLNFKHPKRSRTICWPHPPETFLSPTDASRPSAPPMTSQKHPGTKKKSSNVPVKITPTTIRDTLSPKTKNTDKHMEIDIGWKTTPRPMDIDIDNGEEKDPLKYASDIKAEKKPAPEPGVGFPSITVSKSDILQSVSSAKRYTSGGLQQITPWHLKRALLATSDDDCATKASLLATRWGRGDFTASLGELVAEAKLIALFKDKKKIDVRPISVGCSL